MTGVIFVQGLDRAGFWWKVRGGGCGSCPCHTTGASSSGVPPKSMLQPWQCSQHGLCLSATGKSNHWFCSSAEDLAVLLPSARTVTHSEQSSCLEAASRSIHHPPFIPSSSCCCCFLPPVRHMNQCVRGKYSWKAIKITKRSINRKHRSWQDYHLDEYLLQGKARSKGFFC